MMSPLADRAFERILLIKPSSPGDIIHAVPVLHGLRKRYPTAQIDWLIGLAFVDLISGDPALSEVVPFDRRRFGRLGRSVRITGEFVSFVRGLRARRYDLVIDLQGLFRSGFLAMATGAGVRIGVAAPRELAWIFYTHRLPKLPDETHAADRNYAIAGMLGFAHEPMDFSLFVSDTDREDAGRALGKAGLRRDEPFVVMAPATRWETKCWPPERFGRLAAWIRSQYDHQTILIGGASDRTAGDAAAAASNGAATNLCGHTTLRQLVALIERSVLVVSGDSTPMHVAAALDRPLVAVFGPTNPARTGPYGRTSDVVRLDLPCSPCYLRRVSQCPHEHACMADLEVAAVADAVSARMSCPRGATAERS